MQLVRCVLCRAIVDVHKLENVSEQRKNDEIVIYTYTCPNCKKLMAAECYSKKEETANE